ncbi:MAG: cation diffusion facilitator family transporter [Clostridiales bacterium]|jgi:cation diffusion facilitator family transporter|nr:cation diffusion facilitator family transporter [Clostridiales bacterium]
MNFLKKLLIKDYEKTELSEVRYRYGAAAGILGIFTNLLVFAAKLAAGIISGSVTVIADAINNLSDAGSSVITVFGFKLSRRPADKEHPFGHARYEYITGLIIAFAVLVIGVMLGKSSVEKIISPSEVTVGALTYAVLGISAAVKVLQMLIYLNFGKAISSKTLKAAAADSRNDIIATVGVLVAMLVIAFSGANIDGYMGLAVSVFIVVTALKLIKDTIDPLLGRPADKERAAEIKRRLLSYDGVLGIHDLMMHSYGENEIFATVHVEVSAGDDIMKSHDLIDNIERELSKELCIYLTVHMDPLEQDNEFVNELRTFAIATLNELDGALTLHDFRVVRGNTHTNVLFDVVIPYESKTTLNDVEKTFEAAFLSKYPSEKFYFVINMDRQF